MSSRPTTEELRDRQSRLKGMVENAIRRVRIALTAANGLWQALGHKDADGKEDTWDNIDVFSGIGFHARPLADGKPEGIVVHVGGGKNHAVVVATRDRTTQPEIEEDETVVFNSKTRITILKTGDVVIRLASGKTLSIDDGSGAVALATKADVDAMRTTYNSHTHPETGSTTTAPNQAMAAPVGTSVLRGK